MENKFKDLQIKLEKTIKKSNDSTESSSINRENLNHLIARVNDFSSMSCFESECFELFDSVTAKDVKDINHALNKIYKDYAIDQCYSSMELTDLDILVAILSGLLSVAVDLLIVGVPKVERNKKFSGSPLTKIIRENFGALANDHLKVLEARFKVPYDLSLHKEDGLTPNNHRLMSLAHDPLLGLGFALFDIWMETTTYVNNQGKLVIRLNHTKSNKSNKEKELAVLYYLGHILSDMFTARGIPIPGFFLTQFFTGQIGSSTWAKTAQKMYVSGYDLRHLWTMQAPVFIRTLIIDLYAEGIPVDNFSSKPLVIVEKNELDQTIRKEKIYTLASFIATTGNLSKFILPPNSFNPNALNAVEWYQLALHSLTMVNIRSRDKTVDEIISNREKIDENWRKIIGGFKSD